jgi:predicted TIM-barrel fold metal-dependent hydrolase
VIQFRNPRRPRYRPPPGACDADCQLFGSAAKLSDAGDGGKAPTNWPKGALTTLHARLGIERAVIVQADGDGTDHRALLDAISRDPYRRRGIARVDANFASVNFEALHRGGVRGVRFIFAQTRGGPPNAGIFEGVIGRIKALSWHIALDLDASDIAALARMLRKLPLPFVVERTGNIPAGAEASHPEVRALIDLAKADNCWIKMSGVECLADPPYQKAVPALRALLEANPDRALWGSGFPYRNGDTEAADLVDLVPWFAITDAQRRKLLVENPARLYGFAATKSDAIGTLRSDRVALTATRSDRDLASS